MTAEELRRMRADEVPHFSRARVVALGSLDTSPEDADLLGATIITWTQLDTSSEIFAEVDIRGVIDPNNELRWLSGDAMLEVIDWPRYADQPENLIAQAGPMQTPSGVASAAFGGGSMDTSEGWNPLIWQSQPLYAAIRPIVDYEIAVETLLCALAVAPEIGDLRPTLLAGLRARYAKVARDTRTYPPARYPWLRSAEPDRAFLRP